MYALAEMLKDEMFQKTGASLEIKKVLVRNTKKDRPGIPKEITVKAQKILDKLEKQSKKGADSESQKTESSDAQIELFNASNHLVIQAIRSIDLNAVTPIDALNELSRLKKLID